MYRWQVSLRKDEPHRMSAGKCKFQQGGATTRLLGGPESGTLITPNAGETVGQRGLSFTAGENTVKETCKVRISFRGSRKQMSSDELYNSSPLPLGAFHGNLHSVDMSEYHGCPEGTWYRPQEEIFGRLQNKKGAATKLFNSHKSPTIFHKIPSKTRAPQLTPHHSAQVERSGMLTHP